MALINRVTQLFKADLNAVLDQIEEPEQLLRQAIRDMEDELASNEKQIACCKRKQEDLASRIRETEAGAGELEDKLDLCFDSGKDDLARGVIRQKLESERLLKRLSRQQDSNAQFLERAQALLAENRTTLEGLRQKAALFVASADREHPGSERDDFSNLSRELAVGDDEIEIAFLREKAARSAS